MVNGVAKHIDSGNFLFLYCFVNSVNRFDLRRPIYKQTAAYGHFGRNDLDLPWEKLDMVDVFKQ